MPNFLLHADRYGRHADRYGRWSGALILVWRGFGSERSVFSRLFPAGKREKTEAQKELHEQVHQRSWGTQIGIRLVMIPRWGEIEDRPPITFLMVLRES